MSTKQLEVALVNKVDESSLKLDESPTNDNVLTADSSKSGGIKWAEGGGGGGTDTNAIHDNVASEISAVTTKAIPTGGDYILIEDSADSNNKKKITVGTLPTGGGGEANTASNVGTAGTGVFKQKTGIDLEFKNINAGSNKISITNDTTNNEIDIDVLPANIGMSSLNNDGDFVTDASYVHTANNYTNAEQSKLAGIFAGAEMNVKSDWNASSGDAEILNKPSIPAVAPVDSVNGETGVVVLNQDEILDGATYVRTQNDLTDTLAGNIITNNAKITFDGSSSAKLGTIEENAEVNNISDIEATDLTDSGDTTLHYHTTDRARANHTGTQTASTISDFDAEVANNSAVTTNTAKNTYPGTDATKVGYITVTQAVNLDTIESDTLVNNAKITFDGTSSTKLDGIETGAEVNVKSDWNASSGDAQILNKPTIPPVAPVTSVSGKTGVVVLNQDDIGVGSTYARFLITEKTKLAGIATGAEVNEVDSVAGKTGAVTLASTDLTDSSSIAKLDANNEYTGTSKHNKNISYGTNTLTGTSIALDFSNENKSMIILSGNTTFSVSTAPAGPCSLTILIKQPASANYTVAFPASFKSVDVINILFDGTDYYVADVKNFS